MMKTTTSALALAALLAVPMAVHAQTDAGTEVEQEVEEGAQAVEEGAEELAQDAEQTAEDAAEAAGDAGDAVAEEAEETAAEAEAVAEDAEAEVEAEAAEAEAEVETTTETVPVEPAEGDAVVTETVEAEEAEVPEGTPVEGQLYEQSIDSFLASTLLGANVLSADGEDVGEVNDMILAADGSVEGVVVGVGGFLGLGEKDVAVEFDTIEVQQDPDTDALSFVINATEEELEAAPEFQTRAEAEARVEQEEAMEAQPGAVAPAGDAGDAAVVAPAGDVAMDGERAMLRTPAFERDGYQTVAPDELTSEDMTGMRIYGANDEDVGEISELIMSEDGSSVERAVLDVGGFLGLGEHEVAVTLDELQIMRGEDGVERAYIDATQEELEAQPEYDG